MRSYADDIRDRIYAEMGGAKKMSLRDAEAAIVRAVAPLFARRITVRGWIRP